MTERVTFESRGGGEAVGEIALPSGADKAPCIVLVQEWWGVNDHIRSLLNRLAASGFVALAPDLYYGKVAANAAEAEQLMQSLDRPKALQEIAGAAQYLAAHERSNGKVGVMGFCMGGAMSFAAAAMVPGLSAVVPFYGVPGPIDYSGVTAPIQAHFSAHDDWAKPSEGEAIKNQLEARGQSMELYVYDAQHAFMNDTRPEVYSAPNANIAWQRAISFLHKHLG
jgi:carboxymethylenebutenolidase